MNQADTPRPLTDDELNSLLAPVPLEWQQRDALVRVALRPGLPADYAGPVELADLRLSLSPWHWLKHELATTPRTVALSEKRAQEMATTGEQNVMAEMSSWLYKDKVASEDEGNLFYSITPGDSMEWGHYGVVSDRNVHFLPPFFDLQVVIFFADDSMAAGIVVAQSEWRDGQAETKAAGPAGIFAQAAGSHYDWLYNSDELWLTDSSTGQSCALAPMGDDLEESDTADDWTGVVAGQGEYQTRIDNGFSVVETGLRYEAGRLYRADTNAPLALGLPRPSPATA